MAFCTQADIAKSLEVASKKACQIAYGGHAYCSRVEGHGAEATKVKVVKVDTKSVKHLLC